MKLAAGKSHTIPISALSYGARGMGNYAYWTEPGEYTLTATFNTALKPAPKGSKEAEGGFGEVAVPNQSGHVYLVTNRSGQHRLITVSRPTITGEMYGIISTLLAGRGSLLTPIAAPIAYLPLENLKDPTFGRVSPSDACYEAYRQELRRTMDEPFAMFVGA